MAVNQDFSYGLNEVAEATQTFGTNLGGLLRDRLNKKQYDDFLQTANKEFTNQIRSAQDLLLDESNPDAPEQGIRMLHGALQTYMDEGAKYPDNPYIAQRTKQTWDMNMAFLNQEMVMKYKQAEQQRAATTQAMDLQTKQVGMVKDIAAAEKDFASAAETRAKAGKVEAEQSNLFSGLPGTIVGADDDARAQQMWDTIYTNVSRPRSASERAQVDIEMNDIRTRRAQNKLFEMAGRGEKREVVNPDRPGGKEFRTFDPHNKEDLDVVSQMIDPQEVKAEWVLNQAKREAAAHKMDPNVFDKKYGVLVDPTRASAFNPITRAVPENMVGKILFGVGGWSQLHDPATRSEPKSVAEAVGRLPDNLDQASGQLASVFKQMPSLAKDENITSIEELQRQMLIQGNLVIRKVFGDGAEDSVLDEGMKQNRAQGLLIVKAMTSKYAQQLAEQMGIAKPRPITKSLTDAELTETPGFSRLFSGIGAGAREVKRLISEYEE